MIGMGVASILMLGVSNLGSMVFRASVNSVKMSDFSSLVSSIQTTLSNSENCFNSLGLGTQTFPTPSGSFPSTVSIPLSFTAVNGQSIIPSSLGSGISYGNYLTITRWEITRILGKMNAAASSSGFDAYLLELTLEGQKSNSDASAPVQNLGMLTASHKFYIAVSVDPTAVGANVRTCWTTSDQFWSRSPSNPNAIYNTTLNNVGIGVTNPTSRLEVAGNAIFNSNLDVGGNSTLNSSLTVAAATTLASNLTVGGPTSLSSTLNVGGATAMASTLAVSGGTQMNGNLTVSGATTVVRSTSVNDYLYPGLATGPSCSQNGAVAYSATADTLVYCKGGVWRDFRLLNHSCIILESGSCPAFTSPVTATIQMQATSTNDGAAGCWSCAVLGQGYSARPAAVSMSSSGSSWITASGNWFRVNLCCNN